MSFTLTRHNYHDLIKHLQYAPLWQKKTIEQQEVTVTSVDSSEIRAAKQFASMHRYSTVHDNAELG